ncbi:MAG: hypothetical protein R3F55_01635 [Alphaproteobacteria bacterium]
MTVAIDTDAAPRSWLLLAAAAMAVSAVAALALGSSDESRLIGAVNGFANPTGVLDGDFDHLLPDDLARPCRGIQTDGDQSINIPGNDTLSTACNWSRDYRISSFASAGAVWGYLLATDDNVVAIVDTDGDGGFDRLYPRQAPVYMPAWVEAGLAAD